MLTHQFREDTALHRLISSRRALSEALDVVRARGVCEAADIAGELRIAEIPWAERALGRTEPADER